MDCVFGGIYINDISTVWEVYMSYTKNSDTCNSKFLCTYISMVVKWQQPISLLCTCR